MTGIERFGHERRLRTRADFARVRQARRSYAGSYLTVGLAPRDMTPDGHQSQPEIVTRVGFTIGKRVGNAVVRNTVRRRLRELVRHRLTWLTAGWDVVVVARPSAASATSADLARDLETLLTRAKVLQPGIERRSV